MTRTQIRTVSISVLLIGAIVLLTLVGCGSMPNDGANLHFTGEDPVAMATIFGQNVVANHNAANDGPDWRFTRALENSGTPGVEAAAGTEERYFVIGAAPSSAASPTLGSETSVADVKFSRRIGETQWSVKGWSEPDPW